MVKSSFRRTPRSPSHPWAAYVEASNSFDLDRLMITFADDALVNDAAGMTSAAYPIRCCSPSISSPRAI
jgi:ketosteroid isomerase-like protein